MRTCRSWTTCTKNFCGILMMSYNLPTMVRRSSSLTKHWRTNNEIRFHPWGRDPQRTSGYARFRSSSRFLLHHRSSHPWSMVMTELLSALFGLALAWVIVSSNNQPDDDDDNFGGGMMTPAYNPIWLGINTYSPLPYDGTSSNSSNSFRHLRRCGYADTKWKRVKTDTLLYHSDTKLILYNMSSDENLWTSPWPL